MRKLLGICTLIVTLITSNAAPYFPGAWYATKAPKIIGKQAGGIEVNFYENNTLEFDIYIGGDFLETVDGTFIDNGKTITFVVVDSDGWVWRGK